MESTNAFASDAAPFKAAPVAIAFAPKLRQWLVGTSVFEVCTLMEVVLPKTLDLIQCPVRL